MNNIYLIDWDDTLFPTTWVKQNNITMNNTEKYKLYFLELDNIIEKILFKLNNNGKIFIITNASLLWINDCLKVLPYTTDIINDKKIKILSARDLYKNTHNIMDWKKNTFRVVISNHINFDKCSNIISIGDSHYEYYGILELHDYIKSLNKNHCYFLKNIKFLNEPNFEQIIDQVELLHKCIDNITNNNKYIDIILKEN